MQIPHSEERFKTLVKGSFHFGLKALSELVRIARAHKKISLSVLLILIVGSIALSFLSPDEEVVRDDTRREVKLIAVADIAGSEPLSIIGEIRAVREANVAPEKGGTVAGVYRSLGDTIAAGSIIAELENGSEKAALAQAEAALLKAKSGARVSDISVDTAKNAYDAAEASVKNTILSGYSAIDDAVSRKMDQMFSNPTSNLPKFNVTISNSQLKIDVESKRLEMQAILDRHTGGTPSGYEPLLSELSALTNETNSVRQFIETIIAALNSAVSSQTVSETTISTYRADANTALQNINALIGSLSGATENLKARHAGIQIAEENATENTTGVTADVAGAEANLASARAFFEKTIIRAPITGTISRLDLKVGNYVSPSVSVVYITSNNALEAIAFLSQRNIGDVRVGTEATIGGHTKGVVTRLANALDPVTKKAEVRISVPQNGGFVSGQSVTIDLARTKSTAGTGDRITIPLSSVKITPEGPIVYTVENNLLVAHPIILGTLRGSHTEVLSGIDLSMTIVEDARGLDSGDEVIISGQFTGDSDQ